jgi:NAD(P)-binding Rossmann-like domain
MHLSPAPCRLSSSLRQRLPDYFRTNCNVFLQWLGPEMLPRSEIDRLHNSDSERANLCIVGTGIAGLRCATILHENGFDVTILEARSRVGGRVCLPSSGATIVVRRFWRSDTILLDMPEQSTRISGRYVGTSFRLILSPLWFFFLKLTPISLIRGPQWIHTPGNNPILNIPINSDAPSHS